MYFGFVFLACLPLRYAKNQFIFNKKSIKLIVVYAILISIFSNIVPSVWMWISVIEDIKSKIFTDALLMKLFIKTQISNSISSLIGGFIFSLVLFLIFLSIANFIIKKRIDKTIKR